MVGDAKPGMGWEEADMIEPVGSSTNNVREVVQGKCKGRVTR